MTLSKAITEQTEQLMSALDHLLEEHPEFRATFEKYVKYPRNTTTNVPEIDTTGMEVSPGTESMHRINVKELV